MPEESKGLEPVEDFLATRGIESLASCPVMGHDGKPVSLADALASCEPARRSIDSQLATIQRLGSKDDIIPEMTRYIEEMGETARDTKIISEISVAEKK